MRLKQHFSSKTSLVKSSKFHTKQFIISTKVAANTSIFLSKMEKTKRAVEYEIERRERQLGKK